MVLNIINYMKIFKSNRATSFFLGRIFYFNAWWHVIQLFGPKKGQLISNNLFSRLPTLIHIHQTVFFCLHGFVNFLLQSAFSVHRTLLRETFQVNIWSQSLSHTGNNCLAIVINVQMCFCNFICSFHKYLLRVYCNTRF